MWLWHLVTKAHSASLAGTHLHFTRAFSLSVQSRVNSSFRHHGKVKRTYIQEGQRSLHSALQLHTFQVAAIKSVQIGGRLAQIALWPLSIHLEPVQLNMETKLEGKNKGERFEKG